MALQTSSADRAAAEAELLRRFAAGDRLAARDLTLRLAPLSLSLARRMLGDGSEAEDIAQEALLRLWQAAPGWQQGPVAVSTWLYRVTANLCIDRLRARRPGSDLAEALDLPDPAPRAEHLQIARERAFAVKAALNRLPETQRLAIVLRHFEGCANPEIAAITGQSVEAVESLLARGRRSLAAMLHTEEASHEPAPA